ncbi:prepilin-type N-terminal cleavage/methylation domain-containing protein [Gemmatimonadales bacterium]|nr:prepilin-type N-terminal cleavage/methylation domain-containing protein [Gemmatimonadales bacterium]
MQESKGFTVVELLIVAVIIAILAAIVIPKFSAIRERAHFAAMKTDLKNLASQQQIYYADHYSYSTDIEDLAYTNSDGVTVRIIVSSSGWSASATHSDLGMNEGCAIFGGADLPPNGLVTPSQADEVACTR